MRPNQPIVELAACALAALNHSAKIGHAWEPVWRDRLEYELPNMLPHGGGFNNGSSLRIEESKPNRLVFWTGFHHMHESGVYEGYTFHKVIVTPVFTGGIHIRVTGRDKNGIKEYIGQMFHDLLTMESNWNPDSAAIREAMEGASA